MALDELHHSVVVEGLGEEVRGAALQALHRRLDRAVPSISDITEPANERVSIIRIMSRPGSGDTLTRHVSSQFLRFPASLTYTLPFTSAAIPPIAPNFALGPQPSRYPGDPPAKVPT